MAVRFLSFRWETFSVGSCLTFASEIFGCCILMVAAISVARLGDILTGVYFSLTFWLGSDINLRFRYQYVHDSGASSSNGLFHSPLSLPMLMKRT